MTKFIYDFEEGDRHQKDLLGGKGANLAEMTNMGLPVPPGFTITTAACVAYLEAGEEPEGLQQEVATHLAALEESIGKKLGDTGNPLLVSVRSGGKYSMPGMMDTVLNIGLNDETVVGLARVAGDERFAWDSYRRLFQMFGETVLGVDGESFEHRIDAKKSERGIDTDVEMTTDDLKALVEEFDEVVRSESGREFPQDPREQLRLAIKAVFDSWNAPRANLYRRQERIPSDAGTAVNVCSMVFGNLGVTSGSGVAFTRDPATGDQGIYGDYLQNAQGEDVVAGIRNTVPLSDLSTIDADSYAELLAIMEKLEKRYLDLCDIEFTIERGKLWMLQTRVGKRTAAAAFRVAGQLVDEGLIDLDEALRRVTGDQLSNLMFPRFDDDADKNLIATGMNASPGAATGEVVFDSDAAVARVADGTKVILVRRETNPDDLEGMIAAAGVLTSRGGKTSHAAVVARGMGLTCVCGAESLRIDHVGRKFSTTDGVTVADGDVISIDGSTGEVFLGEVPVVSSAVVQYFDGDIDPSVTTDDVGTDELIQAVDRLMQHADRTRRMVVRANADTGPDATRARQLGAQGIGLCRTEHMFLGERRPLIEQLILADSDDERERQLAALLELQRRDFIELLTAMDGLPATIRLLDPPLNEFLPDYTDLSVRVALAEANGGASEQDKTLLEAVKRLHESNPMIGLRGVRLGIVIPGLFAMQARAILEASVERTRAGGDPQVEIMIPLVAAVQELETVKQDIIAVARDLKEKSGVEPKFLVGTMIELPRAAMTADQIAEAAEFFSFGTNDLTQMTWGFSRDDVEAAFFSRYLELGIFGVSPFESVDIDGVGALVRTGVERGRSVRPGLKIGVCGEHGGDPESVRFFHDIGLDYVSCSTFRVPVARLEAGRAVVLDR